MPSWARWAGIRYEHAGKTARVHVVPVVSRQTTPESEGGCLPGTLRIVNEPAPRDRTRYESEV